MMRERKSLRDAGDRRGEIAGIAKALFVNSPMLNFRPREMRRRPARMLTKARIAGSNPLKGRNRSAAQSAMTIGEPMRRRVNGWVGSRLG